MTPAWHVPPRLAGQPLVACAVPETLIAVLAEQGIGAEQRVFRVFANAGVRNVALADEFQGAAGCPALGYQFDWGWMLPSLPAWFAADGEPAEVAWRVVPVALWGELSARKRLLDPVPAVLDFASSPCLDFVAHCLRAPVAELSQSLAHDVCTFFPSPDDRSGELVGWLEDEFLPRQMPRLLRLLHSLAIRRAHEIERRAGAPSAVRLSRNCA